MPCVPQVVRAFSEGLLDVLVATDVAARGLDLPGEEDTQSRFVSLCQIRTVRV
jgi:hypothetical protein